MPEAIAAVCAYCGDPAGYRCRRCDKYMCYSSDCVATCCQCHARLCKECRAEVHIPNNGGTAFTCNSGSCMRTCNACNRRFPRSYVAGCRICNEPTCSECGSRCYSCDRYHCKNHTVKCEGECGIKWCTGCASYHLTDVEGKKLCAQCRPLAADPEETLPDDDMQATYDEIAGVPKLLRSSKKAVKLFKPSCCVYCPPPTGSGEYDADARSIDWIRYRGQTLQYSTKPNNWPMFKQPWENTLYLGVEWEMNFKPKDETNVKATVQKYLPGSYIWKRDGSVDPGAELVLAPRTLQSYHTIDLKNLCKDLHSAGARGYSLSQCGIHVHVNKVGFPIEDMQKIMAFFMVNRTFIRRFAQRSSSQLRRYAMVPNELSSWYNGAGIPRHCAINRTNETWEFRVFRSTTKYERVKATLQFVDAVISWARTVSIMTASGPDSELSFRTFVAENDEYQFLDGYLRDKHPALCTPESINETHDAEAAEDLFDDSDDDSSDDDSDSDPYFGEDDDS